MLRATLSDKINFLSAYCHIRGTQISWDPSPTGSDLARASPEGLNGLVAFTIIGLSFGSSAAISYFFLVTVNKKVKK